MKTATRLLKLDELSARSGVPPRTIRLYIARGLLPGPLKAGRDAAYGPEHLDRLTRIREMQGRGRTLKEIGLALAERGAPPDLPSPTAWWAYPLADDVLVWVRSDAAPWRHRHIRSVLARAGAQLVKKEGSSNE